MKNFFAKLSVVIVCAVYYTCITCMDGYATLERCEQALARAKNDLRFARITRASAIEECLATKPSLEQLRRLSFCLEVMELTRLQERRTNRLEEAFVEQQQRRLEQTRTQAVTSADSRH